jgi:hypothetical protein
MRLSVRLLKLNASLSARPFLVTLLAWTKLWWASTLTLWQTAYWYSLYLVSFNLFILFMCHITFWPGRLYSSHSDHMWFAGFTWLQEGVQCTKPIWMDGAHLSAVSLHTLFLTHYAPSTCRCQYHHLSVQLKPYVISSLCAEGRRTSLRNELESTKRHPSCPTLVVVMQTTMCLD